MLIFYLFHYFCCFTLSTYYYQSTCNNARHNDFSHLQQTSHQPARVSYIATDFLLFSSRCRNNFKRYFIKVFISKNNRQCYMYTQGTILDGLNANLVKNNIQRMFILSEILSYLILVFFFKRLCAHTTNFFQVALQNCPRIYYKALSVVFISHINSSKQCTYSYKIQFFIVTYL